MLPSVTRFKQPVSQRTTCVATKLRDKLQEKLPSVTAPLLPAKTLKIDWRVYSLYLIIIPSASWAIDSEPIRAKNKIQLVGQKSIETKHLPLKLDFNPFLPPKHNKHGRRHSLLVGSNI